MKVKVNIMNTRSITMSEAVNVPSLMMMTLIVSEEARLAREIHTHTHARTHTGLVYGKAIN